MSLRSELEIKNILCILAATCSAYAAYSLLREEERTNDNKGDGDSSSSNDESEALSFVDVGKPADQKPVGLLAKSSNSVSLNISHKQSFKKPTFIPVETNREKRRKQAHKRKSQPNKSFPDSETTISYDECVTDKEPVLLLPKKSNSIDYIKISHPRSIKKARVPPIMTNGKFVEYIVSNFSDIQFKNHFRVTRKTMEKLNEMFMSSILYKNIHKMTTRTVKLENYMLIFLWFAGKRCSFLELSKVFRMSLSRSVAVVETVIQFLNNCSKDFIRFPVTRSEKVTCAEFFQEHTAFPDVVGCLINTHIVFSKVSTSRKDRRASVQAICDSNGCFLDVYVDPRQTVHHTHMLQDSPINEKLKVLCQGRYHILAEGEHLVREWLLTPYKEPISDAQLLYNKYHKKAFERVSDSLEVVKFRFPQLINMPIVEELKIREMIIACCALQNICLSEDDHLTDDGDCDAPRLSEIECNVTAGDVVDDSHLRKIGELKRRQLMEHFLPNRHGGGVV